MITQTLEIINKIRKMRTEQTTASLRKYNILDLKQRQQLLSIYYSNPSKETIIELGLQFNTSIKNIARWIAKGVMRKPGCGRKKLNPVAEQQLIQWAIDQSERQGCKVSRSQLRDQAVKLFNEPTFKASKAWQDAFVKLYDIKHKINETLLRRNLLNDRQKTKYLMSKQAQQDTLQGSPAKQEDIIKVKIEEEQTCQQQKMEISHCIAVQCAPFEISMSEEKFDSAVKVEELS